MSSSLFSVGYRVMVYCGWLRQWCICLLHRGSNCPCTINSCQSAATYCKALLVTSPTHVSRALANVQTFKMSRTLCCCYWWSACSHTGQTDGQNVLCNDALWLMLCWLSSHILLLYAHSVWSESEMSRGKTRQAEL